MVCLGRSTAVELAALIMEDLGKGEVLFSQPFTMDCMSKAGQFSYSHTDGDMDFRYLIDTSQGVKIVLSVSGGPLGAGLF